MAEVDVVIPAYNASRSIAAAIRSIQSQTRRDVRILMVNDGSTDDTEQVVRPFVDGKAVVYFHQPNGGASAARNRGIAESRAPYVGFLDADDLWLPEMLETSLTLLQTGGYDLVSVDNYEVELRDGIEVDRSIMSFDWIECPPDRLFLLFLQLGAIGGVHKALFRREVFETVGGFDRSLPVYEDLDLWLRIARARLRWGHVRRPLVVRHTGSADSLFADRRRNLDCRLRVVLRYAPDAVRRAPEFRGVLADTLWEFGRQYSVVHRAYSLAAKCLWLSVYYRRDPRPAVRLIAGLLRDRLRAGTGASQSG